MKISGDYRICGKLASYFEMEKYKNSYVFWIAKLKGVENSGRPMIRKKVKFIFWKWVIKI